MSARSEEALIEELFAPLATHPGADRLKDDAALLVPPAGYSLVVTTDALVAGVHMLPDDPPETIAQKALRVNLSDLAAKGAVPHAFLLTLALPSDHEGEWLDRFANGLAADVQAFDCPVLGGDTVGTPGPLVISVTAFGLVPGQAVPRRGGARPGDRLYVSGTIGDGALGLLALRGELGALCADAQVWLADRYRVPQPRVRLAPAVLAHASASMDVSDGLVGDLDKLLKASGCTAICEVADVPLSGAAARAVRQDSALMTCVLTGGDDYEILCAVPAHAAAAFETDALAAGVPVNFIGVVDEGSAPASWRGQDGLPVAVGRGSFSHF